MSAPRLNRPRALRSCVAAAALLASVVACSSGTTVGLPTAQATPGICKTITTADEMITLSDVSPPVPCTGPHVYEVYTTTTAAADIRTLAVRPLPEELQADAPAACPYAAVRPFLGASAIDSQWGVSIWQKFPTAAEWHKGVRTVVCDLVVDAEHPDVVPSIGFDLRGVMRYADSARVRECRTDVASDLLTCDQPHEGELMGSVDVPAGNPTLAEIALNACMSRMQLYTGRPSDPGFVPVAQLSGNSSAQCWLQSTTGPVTGTQRGGLVAR